MLKVFLSKFFLTRGLYRMLRDKRDRNYIRLATQAEHQFTDRRRHCKKACFVLAGYKSFVYDDVFGRLKRFVPKDVDVCILSSGMYSEELAEIAERNNWSYLSTGVNCVTLILNVAMLKFEDADYIYKVDEDIFLTEGSFEKLLDTYERVEAEGDYHVGFVAPLIPINGYGHLRILRKLGLEHVYTERFERPIFASYPERLVQSSADVARFFWGEGGYIPSIDEMNKRFAAEGFAYSACPVRFSIGFILMKRETWKDMGMFKVIPDNVCLGIDEDQLCEFCIVNSRTIIVSENTVVGHLSFGPQNAAMKEYYGEHKGIFACPKLT